MVERAEFLPQSSERLPPQEKCAVFGIYHPTDKNIATQAYYALEALQHRGQESSGMAVFDGEKIVTYKNLGLVCQAFKEEELRNLNGSFLIGHNRYGTTGSSTLANAQPIVVGEGEGKIAVAENGNLVNAKELRRELENSGIKFHSTSDSEIIAQLIRISPGQTWQEKIISASFLLQGAYTLTILAGGELIGVRDPLGFRPLVLGEYNKNGFVVASEDRALHFIGARSCREVEPGEIVTVTEGGDLRTDFLKKGKSQLCSFEYYYFSESDTTLLGRRIYQARFEMGMGLWEEHPVAADYVLPVPETGRPAAEGFHEASGIPLRSALVRNRYRHRTFIEPNQVLRELGAQLKYDPLEEIIQGKRIVLVDDSIVRGTTTARIVKLVREAGAKEVHLRITAPPIIGQCFFGVDTATKKELIAANYSLEEITQKIGADSLGYLSLGRGLKAIGDSLAGKVCTACFTGNYPIPVPGEGDKLVLER